MSADREASDAGSDATDAAPLGPLARTAVDVKRWLFGLGYAAGKSKERGRLAAAAVGNVIQGHYNPENGAFLSRETISDECGVSVKSVTRVTAWATRNGWLRVTEVPGSKGRPVNCYWPHMPPGMMTIERLKELKEEERRFRKRSRQIGTGGPSFAGRQIGTGGAPNRDRRDGQIGTGGPLEHSKGNTLTNTHTPAPRLPAESQPCPGTESGVGDSDQHSQEASAPPSLNGSQPADPRKAAAKGSKLNGSDNHPDIEHRLADKLSKRDIAELTARWCPLWPGPPVEAFTVKAALGAQLREHCYAEIAAATVVFAEFVTAQIDPRWRWHSAVMAEFWQWTKLPKNFLFELLWAPDRWKNTAPAKAAAMFKRKPGPRIDADSPEGRALVAAEDERRRKDAAETAAAEAERQRRFEESVARSTPEQLKEWITGTDSRAYRIFAACTPKQRVDVRALCDPEQCRRFETIEAEAARRAAL